MAAIDQLDVTEWDTMVRWPTGKIKFYWCTGFSGIGKLRHHEPIAEKAIVRVVTALVQLTNYKHISHIKPFMGLITKEFTDTH